MIKLHGVPVSTYYNIAKLGFLEKGIPFEESMLSPSEKTDAFMAMSPMGKIPVIETESGPLSESQAILRYLELKQPEPRLFPTDPMAGGRAQQIHMIIDLYIGLPVGRLIPMAFFGAPADEGAIAEVGEALEKGLNALDQVAAFDPFICGSELTHADFPAVIISDLASMAHERLGKADPIASRAKLDAYRKTMYERPSFAQTIAARNAVLAQMAAANAS